VVDVGESSSNMHARMEYTEASSEGTEYRTRYRLYRPGGREAIHDHSQDGQACVWQEAEGQGMKHFRALGEYFFMVRHTQRFLYRPRFFYYKDRRHSIRTTDHVYEVPQFKLASRHF